MDINNDKGKGKEREKKRKRKRASEKKKAQYGKPINDSYWDMIGGVKEGGEEGGEEREGEKEMKFRCLDCRGEMERRELYVLERCGHCFCVDCLFDYLQGKMVEYQSELELCDDLDNRRVFKITCPLSRNRCEKVITLGDLQTGFETFSPVNFHQRNLDMLAVFLSVGMQEKGKEEESNEEYSTEEDSEEENEKEEQNGFIIIDDDMGEGGREGGGEEERGGERGGEGGGEGGGEWGGEGGNGGDDDFNYEDYEQFALHDSAAEDSLAKFLEDNDDFVACPQEGCGWIFEKVANDSLPKGITDEGGRPLTKHALAHYSNYRFRCRNPECGTIFCSECKAIPYHLNQTCKEYQDFKHAKKKCRFCEKALYPSHAPFPTPKKSSVPLIWGGEEEEEKEGGEENGGGEGEGDGAVSEIWSFMRGFIKGKRAPKKEEEKEKEKEPEENPNDKGKENEKEKEKEEKKEKGEEEGEGEGEGEEQEVDPETAIFVCDEEECMEKAAMACVCRDKNCGHLCGGLLGDVCLPCLREDCLEKQQKIEREKRDNPPSPPPSPTPTPPPSPSPSSSSSSSIRSLFSSSSSFKQPPPQLQIEQQPQQEQRQQQQQQQQQVSVLDITQNADDYCNICWVDALGAAPVIRLPCGHIFHYHCVRDRLNSRWPGPTITFSFSECPLCKQYISHPSVYKEVKAITQLRKHLEELGKKGLKDEGMLEDEELVNVNSPYFKKPGDYSLKIFDFYVCFMCDQPYNGGKHDCAGGVEASDIDVKKLRCPDCRAVDGGNCKIHGTQAINFKCRFCCRVATFNCGGGLAHYCDPCHARAGELTRFSDWSTKDKSKLPVCDPANCPFGGKHAPNGEEFGYCTICVSISSANPKYSIPKSWT